MNSVWIKTLKSYVASNIKIKKLCKVIKITKIQWKQKKQTEKYHFKLKMLDPL